jgi:glycosyltransferase involved in cell wall biosynthesis
MNNPNLITNRDIIVVGQQPWDVEIGSNCKDIALEFAKHNRVLYVNSPLDRITLWCNKNDEKIQKRVAVIKGQAPSLVAIGNNLWNLYPDTMIESINWLPNQALFELFNKRNNKKLAASISRAINTLGFKNVLLFNDNDMFRCFYLQDYLKPSISIYYSRDFMLAVDYWKKHGTKLEPELIAKSDIAVANSTYLAIYCKQFNPNSFYVGQGCDLALFAKADATIIPNDMQQIKKPIIGYVGALQSLRLDVEIIVHIASAKPDWQIVLVGPEDDIFKASHLHQIPNVHFLGFKPPNTLPAYINSFDVCINPQIVNEVTIGNYPRKIDEYLAAGKPTVATNTEAMGIFSEHVYLAKTKEDYVLLIDKAMAEQNYFLASSRKDFAMSHTWENSVEEIYKAIKTSQCDLPI